MATFNCTSDGNDKYVGCRVRYNCATNIIMTDKNGSAATQLANEVWNNAAVALLAKQGDLLQRPTKQVLATMMQQSALI